MFSSRRAKKTSFREEAQVLLLRLSREVRKIGSNSSSSSPTRLMSCLPEGKIVPCSGTLCLGVTSTLSRDSRSAFFGSSGVRVSSTLPPYFLPAWPFSLSRKLPLRPWPPPVERNYSFLECVSLTSFPPLARRARRG